MPLNNNAFDTQHTIETAEGAQLFLTPAGPVIRSLAWAVDAVIRLAVFFALYLILISLPFSIWGTGSVIGILLLLYFLVSWLYPIVFEASVGMTPGKRLFGLIVIHENAAPLTLGGAIIRNLLRVVDFLPSLYVVGLVSTVVDNRFRRLGDLAAGTLVVYRSTTRQTDYQFTHPKSLAPPNGLSREERQAIVDFAERSHRLSKDRQRELAQKLSHHMNAEDDPVDVIKSWAEWILRGATRA